MSRLVWVGVGAAGGILVYRRGSQAWERTKARGVAGNTAAITRTAAQIYRGIRDAEKPDVLDMTESATTARILEQDAVYTVERPAGTPPESADSAAGRPRPSARRMAGTAWRSGR